MGVGQRKLASGIKWRFFGSHKGTKYYSKCIYDSKADALKAEKEHLIELASGVAGTKLRQLTKERLKDLAVRKRSDKYIKETEQYFDLLISEFGNCAIDSIAKLKMRLFLNREAERLNEEGKGMYRVNSMIRVYKALWQWCIDYMDVETKNPLKGIPLFSVELKIKYHPTYWDLQMVKGSLDIGQVRLVEFCEETGCRVNEALRFRIEDIHDDKIALWTHKSKNSNLSYRFIPRPGVLDKMELPESGRVFKRWNEYPKFLGLTTKDLADRKVISRPFSWHNLRHAAAVRWADEGRDIYDLMLLLGHSNMSTTMGYLKGLGIKDPGAPKEVHKMVYAEEAENGDIVFPSSAENSDIGRRSKSS